MSLYKRGKTWYYNFRIDGKRYPGSTKQTKEAAAKKVESLLMTEVIERGSMLPRRKSPLLRVFSSDFLAWVDNSSLDSDTKRYYKNGWRLLEGTEIVGMRLSDITPDVADAMKFPGSVFNANTALRTNVLIAILDAGMRPSEV